MFPETSVLQEPHGVTPQKMAFFKGIEVVTAVIMNIAIFWLYSDV
jgi:hypothetical protein